MINKDNDNFSDSSPRLVLFLLSGGVFLNNPTLVSACSALFNHLVTRSSSYSWMIQSALNDRRLNASDISWIDWKRGSALDCIQQHMNVWIKRTSIVKIWRWIVFRDEEGWLPPHPFSPQSGGVFRSIYIWFGGGLGGIHRQHTMHNG